LDYFGEKTTGENCGMCDNCLSHGGKTEDLSIAAQKLLSCIKRSGESFGVEHVIDVLRGGQSQKIMRLSHHKLSTFGIGREYSKKQWRQLARQLLHKGFMTQDTQYGSLSLTSKAWDLFKGHLSFHGVLDAETSLAQPSVAPAAETRDLSVNAALFEILRKQRKELADEAKVPPFVIFSDKTLMEMANWFPRTKEEFLELTGVGQVKEKRYGAEFLSIIKQFCAENGIVPPSRPEGFDIGSKSAVTRARDGMKRRYVEIGEA
jgi:ATP-dependent DNA helicase RecQ